MTLGRTCLLTSASLLLLAGIGTAVGAEIWYRPGNSTLDAPMLAKMFFQVLSTIPTTAGLILLIFTWIRGPSPHRRRRIR